MSYDIQSFSDKFWSKVDKSHTCWKWTAALHKNGYGLFNIRFNKKQYVLSAHRVSWMLCNGEIPDKLLICHKCDVRSCVNPSHLFIGTHRDNMSDMVAKGRSTKGRKVPNRGVNKGERHGNSKLLNFQVVEIRKSYSTGLVSQRYLANKFGVSCLTINKIVNNHTWTHLLNA